MTSVHAIVPEGIDDRARPSGGNTYDRHVLDGLRAVGWSVYEHAVAGPWPRPDAASRDALTALVQRIPDGAVVLLDGLVASAAPDVLVPVARRLRLVVLVHMPLGHQPSNGQVERARARERAVLSAARSVITTSAWSRRRLLELYSLPADRVHVAEPAVEAAQLAPGSATGGALLCVAAVTAAKGHDVLLDALAMTADLPWNCVCVGSLERDTAFAGDLLRRAQERGLAERVRFPGSQSGADLDRRYAAADLLVLATRGETYGMVVTEALARGVPVVAAEAGGVAEALGHGAGDSRPGLLVPPNDPAGLAAAIRAWLGDAELRARLRRAARERRASLRAWPVTTSELAVVLAGASR